MRTTSILIGPITQDPTESVGSINESFLNGLGDRYHLIPHLALRKPNRSSEVAALNIANISAFFKQAGSWIRCLIANKPSIALYSITSGWNMEKSLVLLWIAKRLNCHTVGHLHGGYFIEFWEQLSPIRKKIAQYLIQDTDKIIVLSSQWRLRLVKHIGIFNERIEVVHNPINCQFEETALSFLINRSSDNTVLCLGVMDRKKGLFDILEAARLIPPESDVMFILAGPEREAGVLEEALNFIRCNNLKKRIKCIGPVYGNQKAALFQSCCIFLLPSHVENFPVTVIEAMAAGLPIVCTPVGAVPEFLVDGKSAKFVDYHAPDQIAVAIVGLVNSVDCRRRLATHARFSFLEKLQHSQVMGQMAAILDSVGS